MIELLSIILLLLLNNSICNKRKDLEIDKVRIAFVFAGSGRSILYPTVYESINRNLIKSFCPPDECIGDVYARVSHSDNIHVGANSKGTMVEGNRVHRDHVLGAIQGLKHSYFGKVIIDEVDIGSMIETDQINEEIKGSFRTKVYYQLDTRRFNMYFNRYRSYSMMLKNEILLNITYKWVVHARLDMAWGTPVKPYSFWTERLFVPDSWYADVPDTFGLIPRQLSDGYFSLKDMFEPPLVACLGGPNFDPNTTSPSALTKLGYNSKEIKLITDDLCITKNTADGINIVDSKTGVVWNTAGNSEVQLKRKLKYLGIEYNRNKDPLFFIPWVKEFQLANSAMIKGCQFMQESMPCEINKLYDVNHIKVKNTVGRLKCRDDVVPHDWNFMPYRIKSKKHSGKCLSYNNTGITTSKTIAYANMEDCILIIRKHKDWGNLYDSSQLLHFYPLLKAPQKIIGFHGDDGKKNCLTYGKVLGNNFLKHNESVFHFDRCSGVKNDSDVNQLFRVEVLSHHNADQHNYHINANNSNSEMLIRLRLMSQYGYCISIENMMNKMKILTPMIMLRNCDSDDTVLILDQSKTY